MFRIMRGTSYTRKGDGVTVCRIRVQGPKIDGKQAVKDFRQEEALDAQAWCAKMNAVLDAEGHDGVKREMGWMGAVGSDGKVAPKSIKWAVENFLQARYVLTTTNDVAFATYKGNRGTLLGKFMPWLGVNANTGVGTIDRKMIQAFFDYLAFDYEYNGNRLDSKTRRTICVHMSAFLSWCLDEELVGFVGVPMKKIIIRGEGDWEEQSTGRDKAVSKEDIAKVMESIPLWYRPLAIFLNGTGWRISEACNLRWENVEIVEGGAWIKVIPFTLADGYKYRPKTKKSIRKNFIESSVLDAMKEGHGTIGKGWVFLNSFGNMITEKNCSNVIGRAFKENGFRDRIACHAFRHTHLTRLADAGMPLMALMESMGIGSVDIATSYYNKNDEMDKKIGKVFEDEFKGN